MQRLASELGINDGFEHEKDLWKQALGYGDDLWFILRQNLVLSLSIFKLLPLNYTFLKWVLWFALFFFFDIF